MRGFVASHGEKELNGHDGVGRQRLAAAEGSQSPTEGGHSTVDPLLQEVDLEKAQGLGPRPVDDDDIDNDNDNEDNGEDSASQRLLSGPASSPADSDNDAGEARGRKEGSRSGAVRLASKAGRPSRPSRQSRQKELDRQRQNVRWRDLPRKGQLTVITLARLSEPLVQTSLQSYMFYQLKSFRPDLPDSVIASQSGILHASFTAAQFLTAMMWGRLADSPRFGRKTVLMIGLAGTMLSCLGFGFSQSFWQALFFRSIGGATNGNVGVLRTMISEIIREKKFQSRAFLILPMTFNIGVIIGPILGGVLSDPAHSYPELFGKSAFFLQFPYALPNLLSAFFLLAACVAVWLGLEETLDSRMDARDYGIELRHKMASAFRCGGGRRGASATDTASVPYMPLASHARNSSTVSDASSDTVEMAPYSPAGVSGAASGPAAASASASARSSHSPQGRRARYTQRLPFRRIFTRNVTLTLVAQSIFAFHMGTFNSLWFVFLSTPAFDPARAPAPGSAAAQAAHYLTRKLPFVFTGGMGLPPRDVGLAMAIMGCFGIVMQLFLYPAVSARLGTVRSWRIFLCCFPVVYFCVPFLSLVPSESPPPHAKDGVRVWLAIAGLLFCHVVGRTFALPAQTILVNNCTPHPSVLGTLHGLAQSASSLARTVGPVLCGYMYGLGLQHGVVGAVFWAVSLVAVAGWTASLLVYEGDGHEIWLDGDVEDE